MAGDFANETLAALDGWLHWFVVNGGDLASNAGETLADQNPLAFGPLLTINAVGVAMGMFAVEQMITLGFGISDSATTRRRFELLRQIFVLLVLQGGGNLFSLVMVLLARSPCEFNCPMHDVNPMHVLATNVTTYSAYITAAALVLGALRFRKARRGLGSREPNILAP
ncbi:MAG: hypothetical protein ABL883_06455 [Terricaulis sp.]